MPTIDERSLILDLQRGNITVFEKIFSQYHKRIYNFCLRLCQSPDEARETVQKVFVALWEQRSRVNETMSVGSYIYGLTRYMVYQDFRRKVYRKAVFDNLTRTSPGFEYSTKDDILYNELASFFDYVIDRLPERQREIFKLNRVKGMTYRQIAERLDISENTVDTQIRRALNYIRKEYKLYYGKEYSAGTRRT